MGYSWQHVYKQAKDRQVRDLKRQAVKALVDRERKLLPQIGTRKLHYVLRAGLRQQGLKIGRDGLFTLLREEDLLIRPLSRYVQTTMSRHWLRKWPNLVKGKTSTRPDEVWVSDITYLKTEEGNCYLNLITDAFSRKIVGYAVADNMETDSMIPDLHMALRQRKNKGQQTIHHSDRGIQYCSREYGALTQGNNVTLSMTENGDPYENALAERMNQTIKEEFLMDRTLKSKTLVKQMVREGIHLYNTKRPHLALNMYTPEQVYQQKIPAA